MPFDSRVDSGEWLAIFIKRRAIDLLLMAPRDIIVNYNNGSKEESSF
jgi:hypothetical protein